MHLPTWTGQYRSSGAPVFQPLFFAAGKPAPALGQCQPNTTTKRIVQARAGGVPRRPSVSPRTELGLGMWRQGSVSDAHLQPRAHTPTHTHTHLMPDAPHLATLPSVHCLERGEHLSCVSLGFSEHCSKSPANEQAIWEISFFDRIGFP